MTATTAATSTAAPRPASCDDLLDPADGRIALTLGDGTTNGVATVNADGSDLRTIVEPGDPRSQPHAGTESPRWTVDDKLIFSSNRAGGPDDWHLFRVATDGGDLQQLTDGSEAIEYQPSVSADGSTIAFGKAVATPDAPDPYREAGIFLIDADGGNERQLTTAPAGAVDERPDISPDGDRVVFSRFNDDGGALFVVNIDGSGLSQLTEFAIQAFRPRWSPDGSLIAFSSNADAFASRSANIWVVAPDGSGLTQVTNVSNGEQAWAADWSPEGTHLVYVHGADLDVLEVEGGQSCTLVRSGPSMSPGDPDWGAGEPL